MIPLLTVMGVPIHTAVGTCLAFVACSGLAGILQHVRQGSIDPIVALTMTLPATLMAMVCSAFFESGLRPVLHVLFSLLARERYGDVSLGACRRGLCIRRQQPLPRHRGGMFYIASAS